MYMSCDVHFLKLSCIASSVSSLLFIIFTLQCLHTLASKGAYKCEFHTGEYNCKELSPQISSKVDIPAMSCLLHDCQQCITTNKTYLLSPDNELLTSSKFILRPVKSLNISENLNNATELVAVTTEYTLINPTRLVFEMCLLDKRHSYKRKRRLLENESASFTQHNLTFTFQDPVLTLPAIGRVIVRTSDYEHVLSVPDDLTIVLPFELLAYKTTLTVIYMHPKGYTVTGNVHIAGKSVCQIRQCIFCWKAWATIHCWPKPLQYISYSLVLFLIIIGAWCLKFIFHTILSFIKMLLFMCIYVMKILKATARCCLLLGVLLGTFFHKSTLSTVQFLENTTQRADLSTTSLVLLSIFLLVHESAADCSAHSVIQSDVQNCDMQTCTLFTTAEVTLPAISSETCLSFTDNKNLHLFSLRLTLEAVTCNFHTRREYFTFPVKTRHISQVSCIYNKFCGKGEHCLKQRIGVQGLKFEAETPESREFPGVSSCTAGGLGVGCTILTRAACNFYRTWYEPELLRSYEVSSITGHQCMYHIAVTHQENNTMNRILVKDTTYMQSGIKVSVLGAYDQPQLHITEAFVQRVGKPDEGYLAPASRRNYPQAGHIGAVQANTSYTKFFIFDPEITKCDFFEDTLRCNSAQDPVDQLKSTNEYALPIQRDMHLFHIQDGKLTSTLLSTAAVKLQLSFSNFIIAVKTTTVCPLFSKDKFVASGCYNCPLLARITVTAHSTCQAGVAFVDFQDINVHTKVLRLQLEPAEHTIKFLAIRKCYNDKLCLRSSSLIQCHIIKFCLDEPSVELLQLNTNYTTVNSAPSTVGLFEWLNLPHLSTSFFILKFLGSSLFIICIMITIISTLITCCCRRH